MKKIPYIQCTAVIATLSVSLMLNIFVFKKPIYLGLIVGFLIAFVVAVLNGYNTRALVAFAYSGLKKSSKVLIMLSLIAMLIGIWKIGGVIPAMLYYSFGIINGKIFLVSSFIISSVISLLMGTSNGTVSTVGIVLIGLGSAMNIPLPAVAGAVVSGAFLGDRTSPISSTFNLVATMTETEPHENLKYLMKTISIGAVVSIIFYYFIGLNYADMSFDSTDIINYKDMLSQYVNISLLLLIPPVAMIVLYAFKLSALHSMAVSVIIGTSFSVVYQGIPMVDVAKAALFGYHPSVPEQYSIVLSGGGLVSFKTMLIVLVCATSLNGILEGTKIIETLAGPILNKIRSSKQLMLFSVCFSIVSALFMCNQIISIIIPSGLLLKRYEELKIDKKVFARLLSDSGVMASSIVPWNVAALTPASIMGVDVVSFLPYAFLSYIMPIIAAINIFLFQKDRLNHKRGNANEEAYSQTRQ